MKTSILLALVTTLFLLESGAALQAQSITVSNALFELPATDFATNAVCFWQTIPSEAESEDAIGVFTNDPDFGPDFYITNCVGTQGAYIYADDGLALYQILPSTYTVGQGCQLTTGIIGGPPVDAGYAPNTGAILQMSLFYLDNSTNMVTIASTNIVNCTNTFSNIIQFVNFQINLPPVQSTDAWANQNIGIEFLSIVPTNVTPGGNWDLNDVVLFGTPCLANPAINNGQFGAQLLSQPGAVFNIVATTNLRAALTNWSYVTTLTNATGTASFVDPSANLPQRFYTAVPGP
jgi:hypothetical protein